VSATLSSRGDPVPPAEIVVKDGALDVSGLASFGFSHSSLMWWGTAGLMAIESTVFAIAIVVYFYLRSHADAWPMSAPPPELSWGTINTVILVLSAVPNHLAKRAAERLDRGGVKLWLTMCLVCALVFLVVRGFEFAALNVRWDANAYASVAWAIVFAHFTLLLADTLETLVFAVILSRGDAPPRFFPGFAEDAFYTYFMVLAWIPCYVTVYLVPHWV
jgi:cytochrome c oxidase subunit 1/cytochrome c oxidase subunit I+III